MLPRGWEEWAPSPSLLPPPARQAAGTCERGARGTACLGHSCQRRETSLITSISVSKKDWRFDILKPGKHVLNIHTILLSCFDKSLPLIDRKPLGHMLTMNVRNRRNGSRKNELVVKCTVWVWQTGFVSVQACPTFLPLTESTPLCSELKVDLLGVGAEGHPSSLCFVWVV